MRAAVLITGLFLAGMLLLAPAHAEKAPPAPDEEFTQRVLSIAAQDFPSLNLKKTEQPFVFACTGGKISLDNLHKILKHDTEAGKEDEQIRQFLKSIVEIGPDQAATKALPWDDVKGRLRPQIFPSKYLKQTKKAMLSRPLPFSKKLLEGFVIDSQNTFLYVTNDHLEKWNVDLDTISKLAYDNLEKASQDLKLEVTEAGGKDGKGRYITISIKDGYAAARILLPEIRKRLQKDLGDPCYVAIPNRDFLIGWSPDFTHKERFVEQVRKDFQSRHHPLTPQVYELDDANLSTAAVEAGSEQPSRKRHRRHR